MKATNVLPTYLRYERPNLFGHVVSTFIVYIGTAPAKDIET